MNGSFTCTEQYREYPDKFVLFVLICPSITQNVPLRSLVTPLHLNLTPLHSLQRPDIHGLQIQLPLHHRLPRLWPTINHTPRWTVQILENLHTADLAERRTRELRAKLILRRILLTDDGYLGSGWIDADEAALTAGGVSKSVCELKLNGVAGGDSHVRRCCNYPP